MVWRYRTILFEFAKDGLLGDTYIDEEEMEKSLNELGSRSWELVNVSLIQEGLLAIMKRPVAEQPAAVSSTAAAPATAPAAAVNSTPSYVPLVLSPRKATTNTNDLADRQEPGRQHDRLQPDGGLQEERDFVGGIRIF